MILGTAEQIQEKIDLALQLVQEEKNNDEVCCQDGNQPCCAGTCNLGTSCMVINLPEHTL